MAAGSYRGPVHAAALWRRATAADKAVGTTTTGTTMTDYRTRFAHTGDPNGDDAPEWARFETETEPEMVLVDPLSIIEGHKGDTCGF